MATDPLTSDVSTSRRRLLPVVAAVIAGATAAATVPWLVARATSTELVVASPGQPEMVVGLPHVLAGALIASLAGWGASAVLKRLTTRARSAWTGLAVAVLLLSFLPVLTADADTAVLLVLASMHVAVGAVLIPGLRATLPSSPGGSHQ